MSKKLLEIAKEKLSGQLLADFEDFYAFLKSEDMTISQGYKCYKFKYKGIDVGKVRINENSIGCEVSFEWIGNSDKYVNEQSEEVVDIFMKALEHKCVNCAKEGCSKDLAMTVNVAGNSHMNICVLAFGESKSFAFTSIDNDMRNMMWITPWIRPESMHHYNNIPVFIDSVKSLILIKKAYIIDKT
ncbi:MAG: hypothetical protein FWE06_04640 [Oscillospiraceae bacterium]|nr:hypothetical protein [Oscillospiraceae bacterium]